MYKSGKLVVIFFLISTLGYSQLLKNKPDYQLQLGSMFSTTNGYGSGLSTYVAPSLGYDISKRFRINTGISIINTSLFGVTPYYSWGNEQKASGNFTSALVFLNGQYKLNERFTLNGTAYKQFNLFSDPAVTPYSRMNDFQGFNMQVDYKATEHFHIQAGFGYSSGYLPSYHNMFGSPFGY